jgi:pimeloyl-ACP methyl ester carboxylesterase
LPTANSIDMARRIPGAELVIYEDAGHGGIFQNHADFVPRPCPSSTPDAATKL